MQKLARILGVFLMLLFSHAALAQEPEMADVMRSNGKIYVVVAMILIVLAGLFIYLFMLDRRLRQLEQDVQDFK